MAIPVTPDGPDGGLARPSSDCTIVGTPGNDVLRGTPGDDVLCGLAGDDVIFGGGGNDVLRGGRGNDRLFGGAGNDLLRSGAANPVVARGTGGDLLRGGPGADRLRAENGADRLFGGRGPDQMWGGAGPDQVVGGPGSDRLHGGPGADRVDARDSAGFADRVSCGAGAGDVARANARDRVDGNCERYPDNRPPTRLRLTNASVRENRPVGTTVGTLSAVDPNAGDRVIFSLVRGAGGQDNTSFRILGRRLVTGAVFDFETRHTYSIRIRATDPRGAGLTRVFAIAVTDQAENQTPVARAGTLSTVEDTPVPLDLAALASDPETADANLTYRIMTPPAHGTTSGSGASRTYTPDADFNGTDTLTYQVTDRGNPDGCTPGPGCAPARSATGTVTITVDPINDAPVATDGTRTTDEDTPMSLDLGALAADVETSGANLTYTIVGDPAHGTVSGTGGSLMYTPNADFNGGDSLTYRVTDRGDPDNCTGGPPACDVAKTSAPRTVSITVNPVNDTPLANDGTRSTDEDTPVALDLAALTSDLETADGNLTFEILTPPAHGTVNGSGAATTYAPDADFSGTDSLTYRVTDRGDPDNCTTAPCAPPKSATGTVTITVNPVNDPPVNTLPAGPVNALPDTDTPITGLSVADVDADPDPVQLTLSVQHGTLTVNTTHLDPAEIAGNGTSSVVITAHLAAINATLKSTRPLNEGVVSRGTTNDTLTMVTDDLGHNGAGGPLSDSDTLAIAVNSVPIADAQSVTTDEDTPLTVTLTATDADGDPLTFAIGTAPSHGTLGPIGAVTCTGATPNVCTANLSYTPNVDYNGPDTFTFTANDGVSTSAPATVSIAVGAVNDPPRLDNLEGTALTYSENDPATPLTATTTVTDVDSTDFDTGTLTVDFSTGGTAEDRLEILPGGDIAVSGSTVTDAGTSIGTFTGGAGTTPLVVTLNANATPATTQGLVRAIGYRNLSDNPATAPRTVRFVLADGDGGVSAPATRDIAVTALNDPPSLTVPTSRTTAEDTSLTLGGANPISVADADAGSGNEKVTLDVLDGTITINTTTGLIIVGNNTGSVTMTGTITNLNAGLNGITYTPGPNFNDTRGSEVLNVGINDQGNTGSGGAQTASATVPISVTPVNDPPIAAPHTYTAQANMKVTNLGSLLVGATDPDTGDGGFTSTLTVGTNISATSPPGGTITTLNQNTGIFDFDPPPGATGPVTFTYTVCDNGNPNPPSLCSAPATVTINVTGPVIWFVNSAAATNGDGRLDRPFNNLAAANAVDAANQGIFLYSAASPYTGTLTLNAGEKLVGQAATGTFDSVFGITPPTGTIARPTLGTGPVTMTDTVTLANSALLRGLTLSTGASDALVGSGGLTGVDVAQTSLTTAAGTALNLNNVGGTITLTDLDKNGAGTGISLTNVPASITVGSSATIAATTTGAVQIDQGTGAFTYAGTITNSTGRTIEVTNRNTGTPGPVQFTGPINSTGGTGINLDNNDNGTITFSGGLTLSTGDNAAFTATNGGTVNVDNAGVTSTLTTTTGTALNVANTTIGSAGLLFQSITAGTSANGPARGVSLVNTGNSGGLTVTGSGTTPGSGGTIQHTTSAGTEPFGSGDGGIYLNNTAGITLTNMDISANHASGIYGTGVTNLALTGDSITANGTSNTNNDDGVRIDGLTGTGTIGTTTISGSAESNGRIVSGTSGSLTMNVTDSTFSTAAKGFGLLVSPNGASVTTTATGNTFNQNFSDGLSVLTTATGTGTISFTARNNTATNNTGAGIVLGTGGGINPPATFTISTNTVTGQQGSGINVLNGGGGTWTGHVTGNTVGDPNTANSGSKAGWGVIVKQEGPGTLTADVSTNTIRQIQNLNGIEGSADTGAGTLNLTMTGNNIDNQQATSQDGIFINAGVLTADTSTVCLNATGNTSRSEGTAAPPPAGNGLFDAAGLAVDNNNANTTFKIAGLPAGSATNDTAVANYLASNNTLAGPAGPAFAQHNASGSGFTTVTSCPTTP